MLRQLRAVLDTLADPFSVLEAVLDAAGEPVDFVFTECNPMVLHRIGLRREAVIGARYTVVYPHALHNGMLARLRAAFTSQQPYVGEVELEVPALGMRTIELRITPTEIGLVVASRDLTEQRRRERERELRGTVLQHMSEGVCAVRVADATIVYTNAKLERMLGYAPGELHGRPAVEMAFDRSEAPGLISDAFRQILDRGEATFELRCVRKDGRLLLCRLTMSVIRDPVLGDVYVAVMADITKARRLQEERDSFFELSADLLCVAGYDGRFRRLNRAWETTLGWSLDELYVRPIAELLHPDDHDATRVHTARLAAGANVNEFENRFLCKDGSYRVIAWRQATSHGRDVIFATGRDVTERRRLEQRLAQSERLASLGTLAAGMGHELNNPLLAVMTNLGFADEAAATVQQALQEPGGDRAATLAQLQALTEALADASRGAERVRKIVQDLRRCARTELIASKALDLPKVIEEGLALVDDAALPQIRITKELFATPYVAGDEGQLAQMFTHLFANAVQAVREVPPDHAEIRIRTFTDDSGRAVAEIRDTGPGIPPDVLPRIFDPFFTTRPVGEGTGLGLAICHNVVVALGGELSAESTERGAMFRVVLPAARPPARTQTIELPVVARTTARARVLIVDDDVVVVRSLERILAKRHEVTVATGGAEALALIERTCFDMILCDLMMPGMSGAELFARVAAAHPEQAARMVFMTGGAFTAETQAFLESTPNRHVLKPFSAAQIKALTDEVISGNT